MSATNKTAVYELPIFLGTDVPSWLTDWNGAMGDIDTAIAAAKAAADAAASTAGTAATDIVTINGKITSLQNTVGTHTSQIGTISGNINTINSLIGNGTPTTTDQTIIGAINELHANQGDLANLTTTDKSSLVEAVNELNADLSPNVVYNDNNIVVSKAGHFTYLRFIGCDATQLSNAIPSITQYIPNSINKQAGYTTDGTNIYLASIDAYNGGIDVNVLGTYGNAPVNFKTTGHTLYGSIFIM